MEGFSILIIILIFWGLIAPLTRAVKKQASQPQKPRTAPRQNHMDAEKPSAAVPQQKTENSYSRLAPTIAVTEHDDTIYQGSLNAVTGEGTDPCHDDQLGSLGAAEKTIAPALQEQARLPFGWTGSDMVRGVVMSEILKRKHE